jgi:UDP-N-acetylglucosamine transferase subunit ALG13
LSTFVTVGNATQPFDRLLEAVRSASHLLPAPIYVQYGAAKFEAPGLDAVAFMGMERFDTEIASARLVITHAGAGSLIHALDRGHVPIVMPREARFGEHVDDHQVELARTLAERGRVIVVRSAEELSAAIGRALELERSSAAAGAQPHLVELVSARLEAYSRN